MSWLERLLRSRASVDAVAIAAIIAMSMAAADAIPSIPVIFQACGAALAAIVVAVLGVRFLGQASAIASCRAARHARRPDTPSLAKQAAISICAIACVACLLALAGGALARLAQLVILPWWGMGAALAIVQLIAAVAAVGAAPLFAIAALSAISPRCASDGPLKAALALRGAYLPVLLVTVLTVVLGGVAWALLGFIPAAAVRIACEVVAGTALGGAWLLLACAFCLAAAHGEPPSAAIPWNISSISARAAHRANQAVACVMAFALVFSLLGDAPRALADPGDAPAAPDAAPAEVYVPEPAEEGEQPAPVTPDAPGATDLPSDAPAAPSDPEAAPPLDYYGSEPAAGEAVYIDDEITVFQRSAREYTTVIGGVAQAYTDDDGEVRAIDNTLDAKKTSWFSDDVVYENRSNSFKAKLPDAMDDQHGLAIEQGDHRIELIPCEGDFSRSAASGNAIRYTDVQEGIDYQYTLVGSLVKEDIVLNEPVDANAFSCRLVLSEGLSATLECGVVVVRAGEDEVLSIAAPIATDAAGAVSNEVELHLEEGPDGATILTTEASREWLVAPERAYPVRIDPTVDIAPSAVRVSCVEQQWANLVVGENDYSYAGYDDGVATGTGSFNYGVGHAICRVYASVNYDFRYIMSEARIDSATFSLWQATHYSNGGTNFGLYRVMNGWDMGTLSWNSQLPLGHELLDYQRANTSAGYVNWDVREAVNNWVQDVYPQYGFCVKAENERSQCELFDNRFSTHGPRLEVNWSIPDPVDENMSLDATTVNLRTITEHDSNNKLQLDGVFADGLATPRSWVAYTLDPAGEQGLSYASRSYKYPDSTPWQDQVPNGTRYKDKLSNWQSGVFSKLSYNTVYVVRATAALSGITGKEATSDKFLVYKASLKDTLPYIANHYGVSLSTLAKDNRVQDSLVVNGNTIFVRNPKTNVAYNPTNLTDDQKRRIDSALMGRGKHCEYGFEPVNMNTGNFVLEATDATVPEIEGDFALMRTYNSKNEGAQTLLGRNWSFAYAESLSQAADGSVIYMAGDGKTLWFPPDGRGGYKAPDGFDLTLKRIAYRGTAAEPGGTAPLLYRFELHAADGSYRCFNAWGLLTDVYSARGLRTVLAYDGSAQLKSITSPTGRAYGVQMDGKGHIGAITLPDGHTVRYGYDANDNLVSFTNAAGQRIRYEYDAKNRMTAWYDEAGTRVVKNEYDSQARVTRQWDAAGNVSTLRYANGATTATDAEGNVTVYAYDAQMRTTGITYPDGSAVSRSYGANNTLVSDEDGTYAYDSRGNLICATTPDGAETRYAYDAKDRMTQAVAPDGTITSYTYDARGNLVSETCTSGESFQRTYDSMCRLTSQTDADGVRTQYTYSGRW